MANMFDAALEYTKISGKPPLILCFVPDLFFASKIEVAADRANFQVKWFEPKEQNALENSSPVVPQLAEHITGSGFVLLEMITSLQPVLMIFDLSNTTLPWRDWLPMLKSAPATRRIPVICFGAHVEGETLKFARSAGADVVLARSAFAKDLSGIIQRTARIPDLSGLARACSENLSPLAVKGLEEFNRREYFEAHETLEEAWNQDDSVGRELYRAILQVAVAYLQIERGNYQGAMKMFLRLRQWIDPLPDSCRGVDIAMLRSDAYRAQEELSRIGMQGMQNYDKSLLKPVLYKT
jgi:predicted metal-dependent hydrolase